MILKFFYWIEIHCSLPFLSQGTSRIYFLHLLGPVLITTRDTAVTSFSIKAASLVICTVVCGNHNYD